MSPLLTPALLAALPGLGLRARAVVEGALTGQHRSPFHGYSSEFSQYRGYVPGDDLRHLDWKVYGRRDQLVTRQYRDETNASVHLLIDTSASMGYRGTGRRDDAANPTKLDTARLLAAALAVIAERQRDAVSLALGGLAVESWRPPAAGPRGTEEVMRRLEAAAAAGRTDLEPLCAQLAARIAAPGFVFLFTDLWQDAEAVAAGLRLVRRKSRAVTVVQVRTREEDEFFVDGTFRLRDLETGDRLDVSATAARDAYDAARRAHAHKLAEACTRLDLRLAAVRTDEPPAAALRRLLR